MRALLLKSLRIFDLLLAPLVFLAAYLLWGVRRAGVERLRVSRWILRGVGVFPIRDHYYEPMFDFSRLKHPLHEDRALPGIDLNKDTQLEFLEKFSYNDELRELPVKRTRDGFFYHNGWFGPGDAEVYYSFIRHFRPRRIVEVGGGYSTLLARHAITRNEGDDTGYRCQHVCIEPYERPWLEQSRATVVRSTIETVDRSVFANLAANDILFIDSSHVIRPQGDVLIEVLEILPSLASGVLVHFHDCFTPKDYPERWLQEKVQFFNEQYLVEAFLCFNSHFRIVAALNYLFHHHRDTLLKRCPALALDLNVDEPGSLWLARC